MKQVFIKYNPYKLETEIQIDGETLAQNSVLGERSADGARLQEWVEELPAILIEEYNDTAFDITFHGTVPDYEDLTAAFEAARNSGTITDGSLKHKPAKETTDKERLIDEVFDEIQKGPFKELQDAEIKSAFEHAKSRNFELCVVATMSSGKSTLINAMLGTKLMPSKQEACTAIITRIQDVSDSSDTPFTAQAYDKEGNLRESHKKLEYKTMERLNADESISEIKVFGNIPFVTSENVSLIMIDTPGPNNSRDPRHQKVQSELLNKSSKALILYIMTGEFGTDDDNALIRRVAESMAVGGKQSKDRFIFVVNKLDDRKKEDGETRQTLSRVRSYLETHGIKKPNLFPAGALPALWIRQFQKKELTEEKDEDEFLDMETKIKKFNRNSNGNMHFEAYASLPPSIRGEIEKKLETVRENWSGPTNENPKEALIHTGIVSIEAAIRQYVEKYAKTAKIKNIVDTFMHKLDEAGCFEETKRELAENQEESDRIVAHLTAIRKNLDDIDAAKKFKENVDAAVKKIEKDSAEVCETIVQKFQTRIRESIERLQGAKLSLEEAEAEDERLKAVAKNLEPAFEVELDELIRDGLVKTSTALLEAYKEKLASLTGEIDVHGVNIDPLKLMGGSIAPKDFSIEKFVRQEKVEDGEEWVENTDKAWYKPWTWLDEDGYWRTKYKTVEYIDGSTLAQAFLASVQQAFYENGEAARVHASKQSEKIAEYFQVEFKRLDDILKAKLNELESYVTDREKAEERIKKSEEKLAWLAQIKAKVESILEI